MATAGRGDRPSGAPLGGTGVRCAELSNGPVAADVAATVTTASAAWTSAGAAAAAAASTCDLLSASGPESSTAAAQTSRRASSRGLLRSSSPYPAGNATSTASATLAGTRADDDPSSRPRRTHSPSRSDHQPNPLGSRALGYRTSVNVPKRTFTPFGLLLLQNPQQRPPRSRVAARGRPIQAHTRRPR